MFLDTKILYVLYDINTKTVINVCDNKKRLIKECRQLIKNQLDSKIENCIENIKNENDEISYYFYDLLNDVYV